MALNHSSFHPVIHDFEPFENLNNLNEITGNCPQNESDLDPVKSAFGFKRKASFDCHIDDQFDSNGESEYPDWFYMIDFEETITKDQDPVFYPSSNPVRVGSGSELGIKEALESGRNRGEIVQGLMAPRFCPWRNSKGKVKKGRGALTKPNLN